MALVSDTLIELLQYRINEEEVSSRLYLAMAMCLEKEGYFGAAKLWKKYSSEELIHADWARDFLLAMDIKPETRPLREVQTMFPGYLPEIIDLTVQHEYMVTAQCEALAKAALTDFNFKVFVLAQKYVAEQIEELEKVHNLKDRLETFGRDSVNLRLFDNELGKLA